MTTLPYPPDPAFPVPPDRLLVVFAMRQEAAARFGDLPVATCGSGAHFVSDRQTRDGGVVEMEACALAKIRLFEGVPFMAVEHVTDGADSVAHHDWRANLPRAAAAFRAACDRLIRDARPA